MVRAADGVGGFVRIFVYLRFVLDFNYYFSSFFSERGFEVVFRGGVIFLC